MLRVAGIIVGIVCMATSLFAGETPANGKNRRSRDGGYVYVPDRAYPLHDTETALARRLSKMWTRDSAALVRVIDDARSAEGTSLSSELVLAVAHAETNGRPYLVSEAGAVGLAQATPAAWLDEGFGGKLFVTETYLEGTRAYLQKKPLYDAWVVSRRMIECGPDQETRRLLDQAWRLVGEGDDQIRTLAPFGSNRLNAEVTAASTRNQRILEELEQLFDDPDTEAIDATGQEAMLWYEIMKDIQRSNWSAYQAELVSKRDELIRKRLGLDPSWAVMNDGYRVAEFLGCELDARFLPAESARFLVRHLDTRFEEANLLGVPPEERERWALALYNGGPQNVKRLVAGLMQTLPETDKYVVKIPATRDSLNEAVRGVR